MTTKTAYWSIALVGIFSLISMFQLPNLQFDFDFDDFFEKNDPDWRFYQRHIKKFGHDNDYILVAIKNQSGIFNSTFLKKADSLLSTLEDIDGIHTIYSPLSARKIVQTPMGTLLIPYLHLNDNNRLKLDSVAIKSHPNLAGRLINGEECTFTFLIYHDRYENKKLETQLNTTINKTIRAFEFDRYYLAGRIAAQSSFVILVRENFSTFLLLSLLLIILVLYGLYHSVKWVVVPLAIIGLSLVVSISILPITNQAIDVLSSMLPTILLITAMSDITHFLTRFFDLRSRNVPKQESIYRTLREVGLATFLTSATTAMGFLSLFTTDSIPVQNLGLYTAIGIMITYAMTFALLPAITTIDKQGQKTYVTPKWSLLLGRLFLFVLRKRNAILIIYGVLTLLLCASLRLLIIDTPLIADFPKDHRVTRDFSYFDQYFSGSKPLEISIQVKHETENMLTYRVMEELNKLTLFLENHQSNFISVVNLTKTMNMANHGGQAEYYRMPAKDELVKISRQLPQVMHHFPVLLLSEDYRSGRITGFSKDLGSKAGLRFYHKFEQFVKSDINDELVDIRLTGTSYLFDLTTESLVQNIIYGLIIAMMVVAITMVLLFKSIRMVLITLIPNIIPLLFLAGGMALFEIPLRLSTSIIFAIAFGIAVDDTIHFLSQFRLEAKTGRSVVMALKNTYLTTGKAMLITTFILASGFSLFIFSSFEATFYTGLLISLTLIMALVVDLTLLPVLLLLMVRKKNVYAVQ